MAEKVAWELPLNAWDMGLNSGAVVELVMPSGKIDRRQALVILLAVLLLVWCGGTRCGLNSD
jgi:hypothetical protein